MQIDRLGLGVGLSDQRLVVTASPQKRKSVAQRQSWDLPKQNYYPTTFSSVRACEKNEQLSPRASAGVYWLDVSLLKT